MDRDKRDTWLCQCGVSVCSRQRVPLNRLHPPLCGEKRVTAKHRLELVTLRWSSSSFFIQSLLEALFIPKSSNFRPELWLLRFKLQKVPLAQTLLVRLQCGLTGNPTVLFFSSRHSPVTGIDSTAGGIRFVLYILFSICTYTLPGPLTTYGKIPPDKLRRHTINSSGSNLSTYKKKG